MFGTNHPGLVILKRVGSRSGEFEFFWDPWIRIHTEQNIDKMLRCHATFKEEIKEITLIL